ncbi:hypothetical protein AB0F91_23020 [Amycolatopsis sp. NPDC023774]|uniref:hypothetical protein n=1 Tax=Amycolatopsis sp. NPDC023774 TaxID=3155015 RepID=UPI00341017E3
MMAVVSGGGREVESRTPPVGIPRPLLELLRKHKATQDREREFAGTEWQELGWVFAQSTGKPLDPRADHDEGKTLPAEAQVRDG